MSALDRFEFSAAEFAAICQVTPQSLTNWIAKGMPQPDKPTVNVAYYNLRVHLPWVKDNIWTPNADDLARKRKHEANIIEREDQLGAGKVMLVADAEEAWGNILAGIRARLLSIPPKVAALLSADLSVAERSEIVRREIYEALDTLAGPPVPICLEEEPEETPERPSLLRKRGRPKAKK